MIMATAEKKNFATPEELRTPPKTEVAIVKFGDRMVQRITYHPGWRWSVDIKPGAGTDSCQVNHFGYVVAGRSHLVMNDGTELDAGPGDVVVIPAGHDAWVVGEEPFVFVDFGGSVRPA
jgi:mannose-6-phosphate isomerase-like protein (cupin superfamily)